MKNIINYKWVLLTLIMVAAISCEKEYEAAGPESNHLFVSSSFGNGANIAVVNDTVNISDFSKGVQSRTWTFPADSVDIIDSDDDLTSTDENVKISFTKAGSVQVRLSQTYAGNVYVGEDLKSSNIYDTIINITVLPYVDANFAATVDGVDLTTGTNTLEAGSYVTFVSGGTGNPTGFMWIIIDEDGNETILEDDNSEPTDLTALFSSIGTYDVVHIASRDEFNRDTVVYEDFIKVVPSTKPVNLIAVNAEKRKINLVFSRDMAFPTTTPVSAITLNVTNNGNGVNVPIASIVLDNEKNNVIVLNLAADLYNSDIVNVSYDANTGDFITTDFMEATSFSDVQAFFDMPNILDNVNFDGTIENSSNLNFAYDWWGGTWGMYNQGENVSTAMAYEGNQSLYLEMEPQGGAIFVHKDDGGTPFTIPFEAKLYEVGFWVYVEQLGNAETGDGWVPDLRLYPNDWSAEIGFFFDANTPTGRWFYKSFIWDRSGAGAADYSFFIRGYNASSTVAHKMYIDNWRVAELEARP